MRFDKRKCLDFILIPFTYVMAVWFRKIRANIQTMRCSKRILLKIGVFPIIDRYWEPMFNPVHLKHTEWGYERKLPGIDFNVNGQIEMLGKFKYAAELLKFPMDKTKKIEFFFRNGNFGPGDAEYLYSVIRFFKPRRIIEIGSGNSTLMTMNAISANRADDPLYKCEYICVEPYECPWLDRLGPKIVRNKIENMKNGFFQQLESGDILFIDSSHIIRPQGDVLLEYLEILPILKPGVIVHVHDIFTPRDYPPEWLTERVRFWNEQYLLEAFLSFNSAFRVIGALNYLKNHYFSELSNICPMLKMNPKVEPGSFYIMKK